MLQAKEILRKEISKEFLGSVTISGAKGILSKV